MKNYDVIVVGAGHAGIEASLACARIGVGTLLITFKKENIGKMSCNPAIGGVGKGQLVKEIDALGGQMGLAADACGIQFRILNASKGPAVQSSRAQIDMQRYEQYMQGVIAGEKNITLKEAQVVKILTQNNQARGILTDSNEEILSRCVVICPGTFLCGLIHSGLSHLSGGRINEPAAIALDANLSELGFHLLRFKTGTCPRLDKKTIDFSQLIVQQGDQTPRPFSFSNEQITQRQVPCHITYTNTRTHRVITDNLDQSPLYTGIIKATGVRYCPSIEDKIVKFKDKERHQIFLEPQGYASDEIYPNGLSTSLPKEVQLKMLHSIQGLKKAGVTRFGYGIEHSVVEPTQLYPTLESKLIPGLFLAGQINGTTGYEEAASQGLVAGINASLRVQKRPPLILDRSSSYIGVLIDDLTTKGTTEPYRMFTSRVEYRLVLREDNADLRLRRIGHEIGLVSAKDYRKSKEKEKEINDCLKLLKATRVRPSPEINEYLLSRSLLPLRKPSSLEEILKRPQLKFSDLNCLFKPESAIAKDVAREVEIEVKYSGFIRRQLSEVASFKNLEKIKLPGTLDYKDISGLSREIKEKLVKFKPINLGQASRISGITPAAVSLLMVYLKKINARRVSDCERETPV